MKISSTYPVIMTDKVAETVQFYKSHFSFRPVFESEWYVSLQNSDTDRVWELGVLQYDHETIPDSFRKLSQGFLVNVEVEDANGEYERLVASGDLDAIYPLTDEAFGQRHFIVVDPAGNLVDVIQNIPPSEEFLAQSGGD